MNLNDTNTTALSRSKYELTLAEFPIFLLSRSKEDARKVIEYKDQIIGKGGKQVDREWRVFPSASGFGTESTFSTLFELFQIWKEDNFNQQTIHFLSIYNILKRKGLNTSNQQYKQVQRDLDCLVGITIKAKNAFWDNDVKAYVDMAFHLFDSYHLFKEKADGQAMLPLAQIKASDVLYGSILKNSILIAGFDSKFFHSLKPLEQRLAIYLTKVFRSQTMHKRDLVKFADQVPIYVKQTKHIKQQIKRTCSGLMEKGFDLLESFEFEKGLHKQEFIVFRRSGALPKTFSGKEKTGQFFGKGVDQTVTGFLVEDILKVCEDNKSIDFYRKVARLMPEDTIYRALSEVKETRDLGKIKNSKGALFTNLIKKYALEQGIEI